MKTINTCVTIAATVVLATHGFSQVQRQRLVASDATRSDKFGFAAAISGDWAAIASPFNNDQVNGSGAVYIFQRVGLSWVQTQKLKANDASFGAEFGYSVAMAGTVLVVGAPQDSWVGGVYVFELVGSTWTQTAKLVAAQGDADPDDLFGAPVATNGNRILIAAPGDDQHAWDAGAAYIFDRVGTSWVQSAKLMGSDTVTFDGFGTVALSGDKALVGVPGKHGPGGSNQGAAYVFERNASNAWVQVQKLVAADGAAYDHFGWQVGIVDTRAIVAANAGDHAAPVGGTLYAYERGAASWTLTQEFSADDTASGHGLGSRLALSADHLIASSNLGDVGSAYDFRLTGPTWVQAGKLLAQDPANGDSLGSAVAISGNTVLLGATGLDDACPNDPGCESGGAYIFELAPTATQYGHCPSGAPCSNVDTHGGCVNSTGEGAILAACGSGGVASDDLQIQVVHCPANKSTLLFMGGAQVHAPFADGIRVVGGGAPGIYRFGIVQSDASGAAMRGPGLVAQSQGFHTNGRIQAGQVWNFQVWYRDLAGPCGQLANYSSGVQVAFGP